MRQEEFEQQYQSLWQDYAQKIEAYQNRSTRKLMNPNDINTLPHLYRTLCHALSIARERRYSPQLIEHLDTLTLKGHQIIYSQSAGMLHRILYFIFHGFARQIQEQAKLFWIAMAIFYGPTLIMFILTWLNPELIYSIVPADTVRDIESMYDPELKILGRERESDTDFYMLGHYIQNNIGIGFRTFATGILFTLGSLFFLIFNGLYFGGISAHIVNIHFNSTFFPFVIGHGSFELTAIVISGMAGIKLGWSLIAPGNFSRIEALKLATQKAILLMYGATFFLIIAAFIEAFWSSSTNLTIAAKYWVGGALWVLVYSYLLWPRKEVAL